MSPVKEFRLTDIDDRNISYFLPFVPEDMRPLYGKASCLFIGAVDGDGLASGVLVAAYVRRWEVLWLYVAEPCRRQGAATLLLEGLASYYGGGTVGGIHAYVTGVMRHEAVIPLFRKAGFSVGGMDGGAYFESKLAGVSGIGFPSGKPRYAAPIASLTAGQLSKLGKKLALWDAPAQIPLPIGESDFAPCSSVGIDRGEAVGACLVQRKAGGLRVCYLHVENGRRDVLTGILAATLQAMKETSPETTRVSALAMDGVSARICRKLAGEAIEYKAFRAFRHPG